MINKLEVYLFISISLCFMICSCEGVMYWKKYCKKRTTHLFCNKTASHCEGKKLKLERVQNFEKKLILNLTNRYRQEVANNKYQDYFKEAIGTYSSMKMMKWDPMLEKMAEIRAGICSYTFLYDSQDVALNNFIPGEMIASPKHPGYVMKRNLDDLTDVDQWTNWNLALELIWMRQIQFYDNPETNWHGRLTYNMFMQFVNQKYSDNHKYKEMMDELFHSNLQILTSNNYLIGCAKSIYYEENEQIQIFVCFTGPANVANKIDGLEIKPELHLKYKNKNKEPGTDCGNLGTSDEFQGLCNTVDEASVFQIEFDSFSTSSNSPETTVNLTTTARNNPTIINIISLASNLGSSSLLFITIAASFITIQSY